MSNRLKMFLLLACITVAVASTMYALPTGGRDIVYYSDAMHTEVVGQRYLACGESSWQTWGTVTNYYTVEGWNCDSGSPEFCEVFHCIGDFWYDQYGQPHWEAGACDQVGCNEW